jgi:hypothetical protein
VSANLDLVRSIYAEWTRGDFSRADWADPDIEFVIADGPAAGSWKGRAEMARAWRDVIDAWENWQVEPEEYRELDGQHVLVLVRPRARGRASGVDLEAMWGIQQRGANVFRVRAAKVTRLVVYFMSEPALADLGLAAETSRGQSKG